MLNPFPWLRRVPGIALARVMTRPLVAAPSCGTAHDPLDYRLCGKEELVDQSADAELDLDPQKILAACARGDLCVGVFEAGRLIGYVWYAFGATPHAFRVWVDIPVYARYAYKAFVRPSLRGRGLGNRIYRKAGTICPRNGRDFGIIFILVDNQPSIRAAAQAGWRTIGFAGYLEKGEVFAAFSSPGARRAGFGFSRPATSRAPSSPARGPTASSGTSGRSPAPS